MVVARSAAGAALPRVAISAAFAAALVGSVLIYIAVWLGLTGVPGIGRAAAGVFIAEFLFGLAWAAAGYRFGRARP